jgi:hypothetical protein
LGKKIARTEDAEAWKFSNGRDEWTDSLGAVPKKRMGCGNLQSSRS